MLTMNKDLINGEVRDTTEEGKSAYALTVLHKKTMV